MRTNLETGRAYIRRADVGPDVGAPVGNRPLASATSRAYIERTDDALERPGLVVELTALFQIIRRQLWLVVTLTAALTIASLFLILSLEREYTATTLLVLDGRNGRLLEPSAVNTLAADGEVEILKSDSIALQVVERLGLHRDPAFLPEATWIGQLFSELSDAVTNLSRQSPDTEGAVRETSVRGASAESADPPIAKALRTFKKKVTIRRRGLTDVIAIDVADPDPQRAAKYSNVYAEVYLEEQVATKVRGIDRAESALSRRLAEIDEELKRSESHIGLRQVYQESLGRLKGIAQQRDTVGPDARIASQARAPDVPTFPNRKLFLILAFLGASGLATGAAYLRDIQSKRVRTDYEAEAVTGIPILAALPEMPEAGSHHLSIIPDAVIEQPGSLYAEATRTLLFTLQAIVNRGRKLGIVLVTSAEEHEGKSTLALSLARSAAVAGARVVIVDCNLRHPSLRELMAVDNNVGLVDLLRQPASEQFVVQRDLKSECLAIVSGNVDAVLPESVLRDEQIRDVLQSLKAKYDVVILDAPSIGRYADPLLFANVADLVLFAIRPGVARPQAVKLAIAQLQRCGDLDIYPVMTGHSP